MIYNPKKPDGKNVLTIATESVRHNPQYLTVEPKPVQGGTHCITVETETVEQPARTIALNIIE